VRDVVGPAYFHQGLSGFPSCNGFLALVVRFGTLSLLTSRLSARVLGDSPISASLPPSLPMLRKSPVVSPAPPRLDRSLLSMPIDNFFPAFSPVCDQQTAAGVAGQMVAVDQAANIGIQFQGKRPSGPAFILVALQIEVALHVADGKNETNLPAGGCHLRLEASSDKICRVH
jgi:hypothetical protein